jgi:hypothetical protein
MPGNLLVLAVLAGMLGAALNPATAQASIAIVPSNSTFASGETIDLSIAASDDSGLLTIKATGTSTATFTKLVGCGGGGPSGFFGLVDCLQYVLGIGTSTVVLPTDPLEINTTPDWMFMQVRLTATCTTTTPITVTLFQSGSSVSTIAYCLPKNVKVDLVHVTFSDTGVGEISYAMVTVTNPNDVPVTLTTANATPNPPFFPTFGGTCNVTYGWVIPPNTSCTFQFGFKPVKSGTEKGSGTIRFSLGQDLQISLVGKGVNLKRGLPPPEQ